MGSVCNAASQCVAPEDCEDTCESQKLKCGEMCGHACGACSDSQSCVQGSCIEAISCENCALSLRLVSKKLAAGKLHEVTLAVDYAPTELEPRPRMADFRLRASRPAVVRAAVAGPALTQADKSLLLFEPWGQPWRRRGDGSYQLVVYKPTNNGFVADGRVVALTLSLDEWGPIRFSLQRRQQIFAPPESDSALQSSSYDTEVIVTR